MYAVGIGVDVNISLYSKKLFLAIIPTNFKQYAVFILDNFNSLKSSTSLVGSVI